MSDYKKRPPTWKEINSKKNVKNLSERKENDRIKKFLTELGWKMWDNCNIYLEGHTISGRKLTSEFCNNYNPYIYFEWCWQDEQEHNYWRANMYGFYDYEKGNSFMHPHGQYEIRDITSKSLHLVPVMEKRIISAIGSQSPLI